MIPRLDTLRKEGQAGEAKLTQYTRYLTIALAVLQSTGIVALARSGRLIQGCSGSSIIPDQSVFTTAVLVIALTAGTGIVMWLGELITNKGIGNGMSLLIFTSIATPRGPVGHPQSPHPSASSSPGARISTLPAGPSPTLGRSLPPAGFNLLGVRRRGNWR